MRGLRADPVHPYAPLPASSQPTRIGIGSWFQHRPKAVQWVAVLAVLAGIVYFTFRIVFTAQGIHPLTFYPLFIAELFGYVTFLILVFEAWRVDPTPRPTPLDVAVDVVIPTYDEGLDIVEPTLVGALRMHGNTTIYLSDDKNRPEMLALAKRYGVVYQSRRSNSAAKAGNINAVLPRLTGELLLVIDADHVPAPDFLEATTGYFREDKMALIQTAHSFRNHNSVMHEEQGRHEQSLFFDVLLPGRNRLGSVFWCGSAALIRLSALREIGGMATRSVTEDFETSLELQSRGYLTQYHNEHLVQGLAPDNIQAYLIQRFRWARGTLTVFRPDIGLPWKKGLSLKQKISYLGALLYYITPLQRLAYALAFFNASLLGIIPMIYQGPIHLVVWGAWIGLSLLAVTALDRGTSHPFEGTRNVMLSMGVFLRALPALVVKKTFAFEVTPKNQTDAGGFQSLRWVMVPIFLALVVTVILALRWTEVLLGTSWPFNPLPQLQIQALFVLTVFGIVEVLIVWGFAHALVTRRQERVLWRFPVHLSAQVNGQSAVCIDLHQAGGGFQTQQEAGDIGDVVPVVVETRQLDGKAFLARGTLEIRTKRSIATNRDLARLGGVLRWSTERSRLAVIEHCYVVEPYLARNRQWMRQSPRARVNVEGTFGGSECLVVDVSIGGAAVVARVEPPKIGKRYLLTVTLESGLLLKAPFAVMNVTPLNTGEIRIGGTVDWPETGWLSSFINLSFGTRGKKNRTFVASPLV